MWSRHRLYLNPVWWIKHWLYNMKWKANQRKHYKEVMRQPLHSYDMTTRHKILICGCIPGQAVECSVCHSTFWSSEKIQSLDDICEYAKHGCKGVRK